MKTQAHGRSFVHAVDTILGDRDDESSMVASKQTIPELLEKHEFHGSTDGLILLRLARKLLGPSFDSNAASAKVDDMMSEMFNFVSKCGDEEIAQGIAPLPGVLDTLDTLALEYTTGGADYGNTVACGLVTGNVEGIARRKMQALGIHGTNAFTPLSKPQGGRVWDGVEDIRFLGGFGSDYCSACIDNPERNYLDRGEQIAICVQRCLALSKENQASSTQHTALDKVIHVGDAPADILAAKSYVDHPAKPPGLCVSVVGVATGSYSVEELMDLCGERVPGVWEPVVLGQGQGVGDEQVFLRACGLI
mmetsp:Transcript_23405/g.50693  ORF Transcript_23405/g.50693 Transcript_23405/m.50693 type:complete len:306 (+) Transcript_23405:398-1315(+)